MVWPSGGYHQDVKYAGAKTKNCHAIHKLNCVAHDDRLAHYHMEEA